MAKETKRQKRKRMLARKQMLRALRQPPILNRTFTPFWEGLIYK